jgi:hypothetical protein
MKGIGSGPIPSKKFHIDSAAFCNQSTYPLSGERTISLSIAEIIASLG